MRVTKRMWRAWRRYARSRSPFSPVSEQREARFGRAEGSDTRLHTGCQRAVNLQDDNGWEAMLDDAALENNRVDEKRERREDAWGPTADEPSTFSWKPEL